jgi:hypothetical protein
MSPSQVALDPEHSLSDVANSIQNFEKINNLMKSTNSLHILRLPMDFMLGRWGRPKNPNPAAISGWVGTR